MLGERLTNIPFARNPAVVASAAKSLTSGRMCALFIVAVMIGLLAIFWREIPRWASDGTRSMEAASVGYGDVAIACSDNALKIAIVGDSHVAGSRLEAGGVPFGKVLESALGNGASVSLFGGGGQTAAMGETKWRERERPEVDLVMLAFGTNDAAPRGWLRSKKPVPLDAFTASLGGQIDQWQSPARQVALIAPPPGGSSAIARRIEPYRRAVAETGKARGLAVLDPADAFANCSSAQPVMMFDALHLNQRGHQCLGEWLAHRLCPETGLR